VVDTTVQEKAIAHPTDARLTAKREGVELRQSYQRVAKRAAIMVGRYTHAHQFKCSRRELKFLFLRWFQGLLRILLSILCPNRTTQSLA
jgi:IS5 family transposase